MSEKIIIYYSKLDKFVRIKNKELKLKYEKEKQGENKSTNQIRHFLLLMKGKNNSTNQRRHHLRGKSSPSQCIRPKCIRQKKEKKEGKNEKGYRIKTRIIAVDNIVAAHFTKDKLLQVLLAQHVWYVPHHLCVCVCVCVCVFPNAHARIYKPINAMVP